MRTFTRKSDDMNEVLADFIMYRVSVDLKNGTTLHGQLESDPDEWTDGYKIGTFSFDKDDVVSLTDYEGERE